MITTQQPETGRSDVRPEWANAIKTLFKHCQERRWAGWDPYDALNSRSFMESPLGKSYTCRLIATQLLKRSPINFRGLLEVPNSQNPKGVALFLSAAVKLASAQLCDPRVARELGRRLMELRSVHTRACWGYDFPWQSRGGLIPPMVPNTVCTSFAGEAMLDLFEMTGDQEYLDCAASAGEFLVREIPRLDEGHGSCISYTRTGQTRIHNASLLAGALLCRIHENRPNAEFMDIGVRTARYSVNHLRRDGSWPYGESGRQQWVDSFHTGYNLVALHQIHQVGGGNWIKEALERGFAYYRANFFHEDRIPKYFHNSLYPIDAHAIAHALVTLRVFKDWDDGNIQLAGSILDWALENFRSQDGTFHYQKTRFYTNRIPYMRWSQAWMLYGMSRLVAG